MRIVERFLVARYEPGSTPEQVVGRRIKTYGKWRSREEAAAKARELLELHPGHVTSVEPIVTAE